MKKYKTVTFGCFFKTKNRLNETLQALLDEYSAQGWALHSFQIDGHAAICVVVFERETD